MTLCRNKLLHEHFTRKKLDIETRQRALFFPTSSRRHIVGGAHPGGYDPQIRTRPRFLYCALTPGFHRPTFTRPEVIVLTDKQTNTPTHKQISNALRYATTLVIAVCGSRPKLASDAETILAPYIRGQSEEPGGTSPPFPSLPFPLLPFPSMPLSSHSFFSPYFSSPPSLP